MKFFVVDDDPNILKVMGVLLEAHEHQVTLCHSGTAAVLDIATEEPDCIITDYQMIGLNGFDLMEELNQNQKKPDHKFIMVTAKDTDKIRIKAQELGAIGFITKPLDANTFAATVEKFIKLSQ